MTFTNSWEWTKLLACQCQGGKVNVSQFCNSSVGVKYTGLNELITTYPGVWPHLLCRYDVNGFHLSPLSKSYLWAINDSLWAFEKKGSLEKEFWQPIGNEEKAQIHVSTYCTYMNTASYGNGVLTNWWEQTIRKCGKIKRRKGKKKEKLSLTFLFLSLCFISRLVKLMLLLSLNAFVLRGEREKQNRERKREKSFPEDEKDSVLISILFSSFSRSYVKLPLKKSNIERGCSSFIQREQSLSQKRAKNFFFPCPWAFKTEYNIL